MWLFCLRDLPHTYTCTYLLKQKETKVETNQGSTGLYTGEPKFYSLLLLLFLLLLL
jgi:hypothetical protein